mmetsp:Transcript_26409/g.91846  ORF Transcript_26409/g.91846 Transcript_26409/m.91846 type:complete len:263 (+) Transcript_26409:1827-2615(+)
MFDECEFSPHPQPCEVALVLPPCCVIRSILLTRHAITFPNPCKRLVLLVRNTNHGAQGQEELREIADAVQAFPHATACVEVVFSRAHRHDDIGVCAQRHVKTEFGANQLNHGDEARGAAETDPCLELGELIQVVDCELLEAFSVPTSLNILGRFGFSGTLMDAVRAPLSSDFSLNLEVDKLDRPVCVRRCHMLLLKKVDADIVFAGGGKHHILQKIVRNASRGVTLSRARLRKTSHRREAVHDVGDSNRHRVVVSLVRIDSG